MDIAPSPSRRLVSLKLRSRNGKDFNAQYPIIVKALSSMPDDTVIDFEIVGLDAEGRPSFNLLQNYGAVGAPLHFFVFDLLILSGKDVMGGLPLRRAPHIIESSPRGRRDRAV